uniref:Putative secreted mucin n=1 Tax=Amblyomma cajennense TaxID=34607 RepID=A0A023FB94_AMBCJ
MLATVFISAAFAFLITVQAASVELAREDQDSEPTTLSPPQSEVPEEVPIPMERSESSGPGGPCAAGPCTSTTEGVPVPIP